MVLNIPSFNSVMYGNLFRAWRKYPKRIQWHDFIMQSSDGIIGCEFHSHEPTTIVTFESEEYMNWFILKWS